MCGDRQVESGGEVMEITPPAGGISQASGSDRSCGDPARQALRALVHDGVSPQRLAVKQELGTRLLESAGPPSPVPIQARHQRFDTRELGDYENQLSASPP